MEKVTFYNKQIGKTREIGKLWSHLPARLESVSSTQDNFLMRKYSSITLSREIESI